MNPNVEDIPEAVQEVVRKLELFLEQELQDFYAELIQGSQFISEEVLHRSGYADNFPHQLMQERGRYRTPASCLQVYPSASGTLKHTKSVLITCDCSRREEEAWSYPFRLPEFRMLELVTIGNENEIQKIRQALRSKLSEIFSHLRIPGELCDATDMFILADTRGARLMQKMKRLKQEFQVALDQQDVALASVNYHEDYFAKHFDIVLPNGEYAHSLCLAFGLERIAFAGRQFWKDSKWPKEVEN